MQVERNRVSVIDEMACVEIEYVSGFLLPLMKSKQDRSDVPTIPCMPHLESKQDRNLHC